jgi:hypothetical protein
MNSTHMPENIAAFDISLNQTEIRMLSSRPQDFCEIDSKWYECA